MKKAVFETATLADALATADRIAPKSGAAFDRSAGVVIEVDPMNLLTPVIVKATDTEVSVRMHITALELGDEPVTWRVPSKLAHGIVSTLPMSLGSKVALRDNGDGYLYFVEGGAKKKARLQLMTGSYPLVEEYDGDQLLTVTGLAHRLTQVAWAVDKKSQGALGGIHIDGKSLIACDLYNVAVVPCNVPVDEPVTAPLKDIASLLRNTTEVAMRATDNYLELMPDDHTQTRSVLFKEPYPNVSALLDQYKTMPHSIELNVTPMQEALERMLVLVKSERTHFTSVTLGMGSMRIDMEVPEVGKIADEFAVDGGDPEPLTINFRATALLNAIQAAGTQRLTIGYDNPKKPLKITNEDGYCAVLAPQVQSTS